MGPGQWPRCVCTGLAGPLMSRRATVRPGAGNQDQWRGNSGRVSTRVHTNGGVPRGGWHGVSQSNSLTSSSRSHLLIEESLLKQTSIRP